MHSLDEELRQDKIVEVGQVVAVLSCLQNLLQDIPEQIQKKWQLRSLGSLLSDLMKYEHAHCIRAKALEILLIVMDGLADLDHPLLQLFVGAIPFQYYCEKDSRLEKFFNSRLPNGICFYLLLIKIFSTIK